MRISRGTRMAEGNGRMMFGKQENAEAFAQGVSRYVEEGGRFSEEPVIPEGYEGLGLFAFRMFRGDELPFDRVSVVVKPVGTVRRAVEVRTARDAPEPWEAIETYLVERLGWTRVFSVTRTKHAHFLSSDDSFSARGC